MFISNSYVVIVIQFDKSLYFLKDVIFGNIWFLCMYLFYELFEKEIEKYLEMFLLGKHITWMKIIFNNYLLNYTLM